MASGKRKIKFGLQYYNHRTPRSIRFWFKLSKRVLGILGASTIIMEHPYYSLICLVSVGVLDELQDYFGLQTPLTDEDN